MADETKAKDIDAMAWDIFTKMQGRRDAEQDAVIAYRRAAAFQKVSASARKGEMKAAVAADGPVLDYVCSPNKKRLHPFNLVSQRFGDLNTVNRLKKWLDANPTPESDPEELVARLNREHPDLEWGMAEVNTARAIFHNYATN